MNSSAPQDSMKALMEAVTQVTTRPAVRYPFHSQPTAANFFLPSSGGGIAMNPFLAQSAQNINNMVSNMVGSGIMMNPHLAQTSATDAVSALAAAQAQANGIGSIPLRKRNHDCAIAGIPTTGEVGTADVASPSKRSKPDNISNTINHRQEERDRRAVTKTKRLEQNRLAAIESRRRKKHMVEELQRSVQFYTKANGTLKGQNSELERQLLVAKQKMLERQQQQQQQHQQQGVVQVASVGASLACPPERRRAVSLESSKPQARARASVQTSVGIGNPSTSRTYPPALFGNAASMDMEQQAQQAQFSATQALYKSMGYPAGAARVAASTFSQFVGQTGLVPGAPPAAVAAAETVVATRPPPPLARTRETCNTAAVSVVTPQVNAMPHIPSTIPQVVPQINSTTTTAITAPSAVVVPKKESDEGDYIQALNRFAMQQAAAANAAAAAANAAIQAVHLHKQMKSNTTTNNGNGGGGNNASTSTSTTAPSSAAAQVVPSLPISFPGLTWPFQGQASSQ